MHQKRRQRYTQTYDKIYYTNIPLLCFIKLSRIINTYIINVDFRYKLVSIDTVAGLGLLQA